MTDIKKAKIISIELVGKILKVCFLIDKKIKLYKTFRPEYFDDDKRASFDIESPFCKFIGLFEKNKEFIPLVDVNSNKIINKYCKLFIENDKIFKITK
jgi:hypothetical protein